MKIVKSDEFDKWLKKLKDREALSAIERRLIRVEITSNLGDVKHIQDGIFEMRIFTGKGYRIYFTEKNGEIIILLQGGHKGTQSRDIEKAQKIKDKYYG